MKTVKEISVQLENKPGTLSSLSELLAADGIIMFGLTVRTEGTSGTISFVVSDPARAANILQSAGYTPAVKEIIAAEVPHHPGGLNAVLKPLKLAGVNVDRLYAHTGFPFVGDRTILLLGVDDVEKAAQALGREWIRLYGEDLYTL